MKIDKLAIRNVTSYKDETIFHFDSKLNILIKPDGGGKSNLQRILAVTLSTFFIRQYDFAQDDEKRTIKPVDLWTKRVLQESLDRFTDDAGDQVISLQISSEEHNIRNIETIGLNTDRFNEKLNYWESLFENYSPAQYIDLLWSSGGLCYEIVNFNPPAIEYGTAAWAFIEYLTTFSIFFRLSDRLHDVSLTSPVYFFFSERTFARNISIQPNQLAEQNYYSRVRTTYQAAMGTETNLMQWATQHFARLHWKALNVAAEGGTRPAREIIRENPSVQLLTKYLAKLGYDWNFYTDHDRITCAFRLIAGGAAKDAIKFSSGEKEIVHFFLAMFALNVRDGLVIIDEPELHLHPRWQRVFLALFEEIAEDRNNQFIIATHSPVFVSSTTANNGIRVYRSLQGSKIVALKDINLPNKKNLIRMIHS